MWKSEEEYYHCIKINIFQKLIQKPILLGEWATQLLKIYF